MKAYIFPGQGAQFPGMGQDLYDASPIAKELFDTANSILGFSITDIMFGEDAEALKQTQVTQPAIFLHSVIMSKCLGENFQPNAVAQPSFGRPIAFLMTLDCICISHDIVPILDRTSTAVRFVPGMLDDACYSRVFLLNLLCRRIQQSLSSLCPTKEDAQDARTYAQSPKIVI